MPVFQSVWNTHWCAMDRIALIKRTTGVYITMFTYLIGDSCQYAYTLMFLTAAIYLAGVSWSCLPQMSDPLIIVLQAFTSITNFVRILFLVQKSCGVNVLDTVVKEGCNKYYDLFPQMRNVGYIGGGVGGLLGDLEDAEFCKCTGNACNGAIAATNAVGATILSAIFCIFHIIF